MKTDINKFVEKIAGTLFMEKMGYMYQKLSELPEVNLQGSRNYRFETERICLTSLTRAKCGTRSTLCWKVGNISGSTELFAL